MLPSSKKYIHKKRKGTHYLAVKNTMQNVLAAFILL
jgi:ribosomal protein S2